MQNLCNSFWPLLGKPVLSPPPHLPASEPTLGGHGAIQMVFWKPGKKFLKKEVIGQVLQVLKKKKKDKT